MPDLTVAVIHWNVPDLLAECLATLLPEVRQLSARGLRVEVLVVDNASRPEVRARLEAETPPGVRTLWSPENLGYPRASNLAWAESDSPLVLISNPDLLYRPGSLAALVAALDDPAVAAAAPATWWDREHTLMLNPGFPEDRERIEEDARAAREGRWPAHALDWLGRMAEITFAPEPRPIAIASGACLLLRRSRVDDAGGLFDPALFLYYDDTDLCLRLRRARLPLLYVPAAEIVHLFNQSRRNDVAVHMATSRRHFLARHYGTAEAERLLDVAAASVPAEEPFAAAWGLTDRGRLAAPPAFAWTASGASLLAVGLNPQIVPAALARCERPAFAFSARFWEQLTPGPYWVRATDPAARRVLGYWRFERP
jgi:GT2 family glycosyltransferase